MQIEQNFSLRPYHTFGMEVSAKYFSSFSGIGQLENLLQTEEAKNNELLILGGGSNILFVSDFNGFVLKNDINGITVSHEDEDFYYVTAGAGENWHRFVSYCVDNDYAGIENLSLIPGNVGASPMQNIGAYGVEIKDVFESLEAFHLKDKFTRKFRLEECRFGYRESVFKREYRNQFVITKVTYKLRKKPVYNTSYGAIKEELEKMGVQDLSIRAISQAVINIRTSKLPDWREIGNAGSFFKNPMVDIVHFNDLKETNPSIPSYPVNENSVKLPAGWLIEQCGWKGYRKGDAGCYSKQALVLVNYGNATGREIYDLSQEIIESVREKFGVELEREVNIYLPSSQ